MLILNKVEAFAPCEQRAQLCPEWNAFKFLYTLMWRNIVTKFFDWPSTEHTHKAHRLPSTSSKVFNGKCPFLSLFGRKERKITHFLVFSTHDLLFICLNSLRDMKFIHVPIALFVVNVRGWWQTAHPIFNKLIIHRELCIIEGLNVAGRAHTDLPMLLQAIIISIAWWLLCLFYNCTTVIFSY